MTSWIFRKFTSAQWKLTFPPTPGLFSHILVILCTNVNWEQRLINMGQQSFFHHWPEVFQGCDESKDTQLDPVVYSCGFLLHHNISHLLSYWLILWSCMHIHKLWHTPTLVRRHWGQTGSLFEAEQTRSNLLHSCDVGWHNTCETVEREQVDRGRHIQLC